MNQLNDKQSIFAVDKKNGNITGEYMHSNGYQVNLINNDAPGYILSATNEVSGHFISLSINGDVFVLLNRQTIYTGFCK